jgi:coenzyme Q-binding protein COQ10
MPQASVKRLIECKKDQLIDLVLDIEKYPEFVPFCLDSHVYEKNKEGSQTLIIADLTIGKGPFKDTYKSDVKFDKENSTINVTNIGGPLNHLKIIGNLLKQKEVLRFLFDIDFEIENKFLNVLMSKSFEFGLNKIADAFQKRAEDLYRPIDN